MPLSRHEACQPAPPLTKFLSEDVGRTSLMLKTEDQSSGTLDANAISHKQALRQARKDFRKAVPC